MLNDKPWATQGLSHAKRAEALETCLILQELDIDKLEEAIEAAVRDTEPRWIPVMERLPSVDTWCVVIKKRAIEEGYYQDFCRYHNPQAWENGRVLYWLEVPPLPEQPKE